MHVCQNALREGFPDQVIEWCEDSMNWLQKLVTLSSPFIDISLDSICVCGTDSIWVCGTDSICVCETDSICVCGTDSICVCGTDSICVCVSFCRYVNHLGVFTLANKTYWLSQDRSSSHLAPIQTAVK